MKQLHWMGFLFAAALASSGMAHAEDATPTGKLETINSVVGKPAPTKDEECDHPQKNHGEWDHKKSDGECDHHPKNKGECDHKKGECDHHGKDADHCDHKKGAHTGECDHKKHDGDECESHPKKSKKHASKKSPDAASVSSESPAKARKIKPAQAASSKVSEALSVKDGLALAGKNNCLACHSIDKKIVGPAWKDVAAKYRGDASAEAKLLTKVSKGGSGVWGSVAMPANDPTGAKQGDIKALVKFVLSLN
jgi:cytochrome c